MEPAPKCDHSYTTLGNRVFRCDAAPHPNRPDEHYFVRDEKAQDALNEAARNRQRRNGLALVPRIPGDRG